MPSAHKFDRTTQISLSSSSDETQIQVVQRYPASLRAILHFLPGAWGAMIGAAVAASVGVTALGTVGVGVAAAAIGMGIGRSIWQTVARRSERQVEEIATALVTATGDITEG
jgi:CO/xanthine dehydrogenase Mo-binding subunit